MNPEQPIVVLKQESTIKRDHVLWAYRLFLDRECEKEENVINMLNAFRTTQELRVEFMTSPEFRQKNPDLAFSSERNIVIKELHGGVRLFIDLSDLAIGLNVIRGRYEPSEAAFIRAAVKPGQVALDVGANNGFHTMLLASLVGDSGFVHAFEPYDRNADLLEKSILENRFQERVLLHRLAVGETSRSIKLVTLEHSTNSGGAYVIDDESRAPTGHQLKDVKLVPLDGLPIRRPVRFIKIDIEGAEPLAFRGAQKILREDRPVIISELHPVQLARVAHTTPEDVIAEMRSLGYACYLVENGRATGPARREHLASIRTVAFMP